MSDSFDQNGFEITRGVIGEEEVATLRKAVADLSDAAKSSCVRNLRSKSKAIDVLSRSPALLDLVSEGMTPVRSILFDKSTERNWPVAWHQDLTIALAEKTENEGFGPWTTKDSVPHAQAPLTLLQSMCTLRIHLDDTSEENGALRVVPGSHRSGILKSEQIALNVADEGLSCDCGAGDVLRMSPLLLHSSSRSRVATRRRVIHLEYAPSNALDSNMEWHEDVVPS